MEKRLSILHIEDDLNDAELIRSTLADEGIACDIVRVETRHDLVSAIDQGRFDLILSDHSLPSLTGIDALEIAREKSPDTPFIFVSGAMGEDLAIETFKMGSTDYVLKGKLSRLGPAVRRALQEAQNRAERAMFEAHFHHAQKMEAVGQLAGGIAHDFNNILTVIVGFAGILKLNIGKDDPLVQHIEQILSASERASCLVRRLLAFTRKQTMEFRPENINEIIRETGNLLRRVIREDIELKFNLSQEAIVVMVDKVQIEEVLMNLVMNARDAMPDGGILSIETGLMELSKNFVGAQSDDKPGLYAVISVSDNGEGMDEKTRERVFEPFFTTKEVGKGTGLGLSMTYGIVKQHGGYVNVYSEKGHGTTFKIYLPAVIDSLVVETKLPEYIAPNGGTETILVIEDDVKLRSFFSTLLSSFGYNVIEATDGEDGINKFMENKDKIAILLLDVIMPKKNGKEVLSEIRKTSSNVKVLFISGYTGDVIQSMGITDKELNLISKPVMPADLLRKVREVLDKDT